MVHYPKLAIVFIIAITTICVIAVIKRVDAAEKMAHQERIVLDFSRAEDKEAWQIINDGVMGGLSQSKVFFSASGTAIFQGIVSLENNGGFASTRTAPRPYYLKGYSGLLMQVRGDGKDYQLRLRSDNRLESISYRYRFTTQSGSTQTVRALFKDFQPVFRGRVIDNAAPLSPANIQQIGFLIANSQAGTFRIEIDWIKAFK